MNHKIKIIGGVIFVLLLVLLFFSKTIYTYNIPEVTAVLPKNGKLSKTETATGIADWSNIREIYFEVAGKVDEILVEEGDTVSQGQELARMSFDTDDLTLRQNQLKIERDKLQVSMESSQLKITKLKNQIVDLNSEIYDLEEASEYAILQTGAKIEKAEESLEKARENAANARLLYESGAISGQERDKSETELRNAEYDLDAMLREYENLIETRAKNEKDNLKSFEDKEKSRTKQISDWQYEIETLEKDLHSKELDIQKNLEEQAGNEKLLQNYSDNLSIYAPVDATIISLPVKTGQAVNKNQLMTSMGMGNSFTVQCSVSLKNNFVMTGDECRLSNTDHTFAAKISKITPTQAAKEVTIKIESDEITAGETFDIEFGKESAKSAVLVPNGAVNKDSDSYFVYYIKKRKGIMGDEYYAAKSAIYIGDSDNDNTIVTSGITFFEPIVLLSDKPFEDGETIKIKNEGDFFVN